MSRAKQQPIRYRFISIDEECTPSTYPFSRTATTTTSTITPSSSSSSLEREPPKPEPPNLLQTPNNDQLPNLLPKPPISLLHQFYNELMIPTFPLEDERDDIEDWLECFTTQRKLHLQKNRIRYWNEVKEVLMDGLLDEVGVVEKVMGLMQDDCNGKDGEEEDCEFDGPAMDVILMVQNHDHDRDIIIDSNDAAAANEDGRKQFFKRGSSRSLLLQTQKSLYGGLYAPEEKDEENDSGDGDGGKDKTANGMSSLMDRTISEDEATTTNTARQLHDATQLSKRSCVRNSLLGKRVSLQDEDEAEEEIVNKAKQDDTTTTTTNIQNNSLSTKQTIIGGAAVEYYKQSRVGLLSYVVLHDEFRGCGLARHLHEEALRRLEALAKCYGTPVDDDADDVEEMATMTELAESSSTPSNPTQPRCAQVQNGDTKPLLQAVFAETNTPAAGDVTPTQSLLRHKSLYNLGYRLVRFPYAQPPLTTVDVNASFDDLVLLVYFPFFENDAFVVLEKKERLEDEEGGLIMERYCPWFMEEQQHLCGVDDGDDDGQGESKKSNTIWMNVSIPFGYVEDFYRSVFRFDSEACTDSSKANTTDDDTVGREGIPDYRTADYYNFAHWFARDRPNKSKGVVEVSLCSPRMPWEDCKDGLKLEWKEWQEISSSQNNAVDSESEL